MSPLSRRTVTRRSVGHVVALAGCVGRVTDGSASTESTPTESTPTASCTAADPPRPTAAAADPERYPEKPAQLTLETVRSYVREYEHAYQYNAKLADHPEKIGRLNELIVDVGETTVESDGNQFTAVVSGGFYDEFVDDSSTTPETPTETPLPMAHGSFDASYLVSERRVRRESVVVECW